MILVIHPPNVSITSEIDALKTTASRRGQARPGEPAPIGVRVGRRGDGSLVMVPIPYVYTFNLQLNETRFA